MVVVLTIKTLPPIIKPARCKCLNLININCQVLSLDEITRSKLAGRYLRRVENSLNGGCVCYGDICVDGDDGESRAGATGTVIII